jgi:hypothetical protein
MHASRDAYTVQCARQQPHTARPLTHVHACCGAGRWARIPGRTRDVLLATHRGLSLELCAVLSHISPMALYRLVCVLGQHSLVMVLVRCRLPLPLYILADAKHSRCLTERVDLTTIVRSRVLRHLGCSASKSTAAFTESYMGFNTRPLCMSRHTRCGASSLMALIVPLVVWGPCFQEHVWASACATRSPSSRAN